MYFLSNKKKAYKFADTAFLCSIAFYLLFITARKTTFELDLKWEKWDWIRFVLLILGLIRLLCLYFQEETNRQILIRTILAALPVALLWMLIYHNDRYEFLRYLAILTICCIGCDYRKLLRIYVIIVGITVITAVLSALGGAVDNLVYLDGAHIRSAWGISYTTDFASFLVFLCFASWVAWPKTEELLFLIPGLCGLFICYFICHSSTGIICLSLFCFFILLHRFFSKTKFFTVFTLMNCFSFPLFCSLMLALTAAYGKGFAFTDKLNALLHQRLRLSVEAYRQYGITLFGTPFDLSGSGRSTLVNNDYNFVDSSYLMILLRYGIIILAVLCIIWTIMSFKARLAGNTRLLFALSVTAIHAVSEHHFPDVNYNFYIILPFCFLYSVWAEHTAETADSPDENKHVKCQQIFTFLFCTICLLIITVFPLGSLLSVFRTLCSILGMNTGVYHQRALFLAVFSGLFLFILLLLLYGRFFFRLITEKKAPRGFYALLASTIAISAVILIGTTLLMTKFKGKYQGEITNDLSILDKLESEKNLRVHVDDIPAFYPSSVVTTGLLNGEDLVRKPNTVLITSSHSEYTTLLRRGFLYTPLSDTHGLYTNSDDAVSALSKEGYLFRGYFPTAEKLDLESIVRKNKLETAESEILLDELHPIEEGPKYNLSESDYTVTYSFSNISEGGHPVTKETVLGVAKVFSQNTETVLKEQTFVFNPAETSPELSFKLNLSVPDTTGIVFQLYPAADVTLYLKDISYQKTPLFDIHNRYNNLGQIIHRSYYDLEGQPLKKDLGCEQCGYEYDQKGNIICQRWFDSDGNPVLNENEFAIQRNEYDAAGMIIRRQYYSESDAPVLIKDGYFSCDYEYDQNGNCLSRKYHGLDLEPIMTIWGCAEQRYYYDDLSRKVKEDFRNTHSELCKSSIGVAVIKYQFDHAGNIISTNYFDEAENPCLYKNYASVTKKYNNRNQLIQEEFFGINGEKVTCSKGYHSAVFQYDLNGNLTEIQYFDPDNHKLDL